jgi:CheY-like chemotaxis protein
VVVEASNEPREAVEKLRATSMLGETWTYELVLIDGNGIDQRLPGLLAEIRNIETIKHVHVVVSVRSESLAQKLRRDYGVLLLSDALRPEPLRRLLYRVFDVESQHYGNPELRMEEVYDDLNVSVGDVVLDEEGGDEDAKAPLFAGSVLLVEDNPVNLGVVKKALSKLGLQCASAADGREALSLFAEQTFEVIFMDCQMPVMDGYEATAEIRHEEAIRGMPRTPIVAMTANAMAGDREKCIDAGMDDYLPKPVGLSELRECVARWLLPQGVKHPPADRAGNTAMAVDGAAPAAPPEENVLDPKVLHELKEIMDDDYLGLLHTFLRNAPTLLTEAGEAVSAGDVEAMVRPVHSLKSSSANVGAMRLSELARDAERYARAGDFTAAQQAFVAVGDAYREAEAALRAHAASASLTGA